MSEMVERVAKALRRAGVDNPAHEEEALARAAIEAMRIPGLIVIEEAGYPAEYSDAWDYVLNTALSPSREDGDHP